MVATLSYCHCRGSNVDGCTLHDYRVASGVALDNIGAGGVPPVIRRRDWPVAVPNGGGATVPEGNEPDEDYRGRIAAAYGGSRKLAPPPPARGTHIQKAEITITCGENPTKIAEAVKREMEKRVDARKRWGVVREAYRSGDGLRVEPAWCTFHTAGGGTSFHGTEEEAHTLAKDMARKFPERRYTVMEYVEGNRPDVPSPVHEAARSIAYLAGVGVDGVHMHCGVAMEPIIDPSPGSARRGIDWRCRKCNGRFGPDLARSFVKAGPFFGVWGVPKPKKRGETGGPRSSIWLHDWPLSREEAIRLYEEHRKNPACPFLVDVREYVDKGTSGAVVLEAEESAIATESPQSAEAEPVKAGFADAIAAAAPALARAYFDTDARVVEKVRRTTDLGAYIPLSKPRDQSHSLSPEDAFDRAWERGNNPKAEESAWREEAVLRALLVVNRIRAARWAK